MKKIKSFIAVLTAVIIATVVLPETFLNIKAAADTHNIIWEADTDMLLADSEGKLNASFISGYGEAKYSVYKKNDMTDSFYSVEFSETGNGSTANYAAAKGAFNDKTSNFGWLNSKSTLNAIAPYLYVSFDYRVKGSEELPDDTKLTVNASQAYDPDICTFAETAVANAEEWTSYPLTKITDTSFETSWYSGFITFNLTSISGGLSGTQTVEIKNIVLVLSDIDKNAVNKALNKVSGIGSITNFTAGIFVSGSTGRKDYQKLLTLYDEYSASSGRSHTNSYTVCIDYSKKCDISVSRTRADGSDDKNYADSVTVKVSPEMNYNIKEVTATATDGTTVIADTVTRNSEYTFNMPAADVKVSASVVYEEERDIAFLWKSHPGTLATNPWYIDTASKPYTWSVVDGGDQSAYQFEVTKNVGAVTVYGSKNANITLDRYFDSAYFYTSIKLVTESDNRSIKIGISSGKTVDVAIPDTEEYTLIKIPLKDIATTANFGYFRVYLDNRQVGDSICVGETFVFNKELDSTVSEAWSQIFDISDYTKSETNTLLGVIGDTEGMVDPWCEDWNTGVKWDIAWYYSFQNIAPYILLPNEELMGKMYFTTFYGEKNIDASKYIDTGYLEFYIYSDTDGIEVPFSVESAGHSVRTFATFKVKYDKSKAREDGYMQVRIPFTYFADAGLNMDRLCRVTLKGTQTSLYCDYFLISSFRFYTNLADVPDPEPIIEPQPEPERDLPLELDSSIINAKLDKGKLTLYIPDKTQIWEILAALSFDTNETNVDFYDGKFIEDDETVITDDMIMVVYRRGFLLTKFEISLLTEKINTSGAVVNTNTNTSSNNILQATENVPDLPDTGDESMPIAYLLWAIVSSFGVLTILINRKRFFN